MLTFRRITVQQYPDEVAALKEDYCFDDITHVARTRFNELAFAGPSTNGSTMLIVVCSPSDLQRWKDAEYPLTGDEWEAVMDDPDEQPVQGSYTDDVFSLETSASLF